MHTSSNPAAAASPFPYEGPTDLQQPACAAADLIVMEVESELDRVLRASYVIDVELCWEPAWTHEKTSERAKRSMRW